MPSAIVNSDSSLHEFLGAVRADYAQHRWLKFTWKNGKGRSLDQNAISFVWYQQMARELREDDTKGWRRYCKLHHGVPILCAEDDEYRDAFAAVIWPHPYELQLQAMDHWPVTSLMTKPQLSAYLKELQDDFRKRGVILEFPKEEVPA